MYYEFKLNYFAIRILKQNGMLQNVVPDITTKKIYWLAPNGNHLEDYCFGFSIPDLETGDVVEYAYEIEYKGSYGADLFYFNCTVAKRNTQFEVNYLPVEQFESYEVLCNINIPPENCLKEKNIVFKNNEKKCRYTYTFQNLKPVNYLHNSCVGKRLPHFSIDQDFVGSTITGIGLKELVLVAKRGPHFEWAFVMDTLKRDAIYNKQYANIRKFVSVLPAYELKNSSTFLLALNTNLNALTFVSAESMNYSKNMQYSVASGEWLNKGKLIEEFMKQVYFQILNEANVPFYIICLQDKRLGDQKINIRAEKKYERCFFAIPDNKNLVYLQYRTHGLKYHINEIPFYFEGATAALLYNSYATTLLDKNDSVNTNSFRFIKTRSSNENENIRIENAVFKVNLDSAFINTSIKQNLIGQFSTIVRPFYLNETIDSSVNHVYFKKCTEKPNAQNIKINVTSKSETYPFKYSFNCSEKITIPSNTELPLKDWFSFTYNKNVIPEKPNFDYHFDFKYTDVYNYAFEFNKAVTIVNPEDFTKSIKNNYFELSSSMVKQTETAYLLNVMVKIKEEVLPESKAQELIAFSHELDNLNHAVLKLK